MTSVSIYFLFAVVSVLYGLTRLNKSKTDRIYPTYAGSISEPHNLPADCKIERKKSCVIKLPDNLYANTRSFYRILIIGDCMDCIGIHQNEEWLASKLKKKKKIAEQIKTGDVLLIYLEDKNIYKIRRFDSIDENGKLKTYSYNRDGSIHYSSNPHSPNSVLGIVRYKVS